MKRVSSHKHESHHCRAQLAASATAATAAKPANVVCVVRPPATRAQTSSAARNSVTAAIALNASDYSGGPRSDDFARQRQRQTNWATVNCTKTNSDDKRGFHRAANILRKKNTAKKQKSSEKHLEDISVLIYLLILIVDITHPERYLPYCHNFYS